MCEHKLASDSQNYMRKLMGDLLLFEDECQIQLNWDCVVISAADTEQKKCFQLQLQEKVFKKDIPNLKYLVVEDPPGHVIGSGGSTMHVLSELKKMYGPREDLHSKKILLIHAGGFSKRLPNLSCTGKLFCPLPIEVKGDKLVCLLQLKLIITYPFLKFMKRGGVFITGSDDLETFSLDGIDDAITSSNFNESGVTAVAHPSTIAIGETHGVYVLPINEEKKKVRTACWTSTCLEVLQKPSRAEMESHAAIINSNEVTKPVVYTDSMFWCGPDLVKKMVQFAEEHKDDLYRTETCIYGDFLVCMGTRQTEEKLFWGKLPPSGSIKRKIADSFHSSPLSVLVLEKSKFYHLGTMSEYLENLCPSSELFSTLGMKSVVRCRTRNKLICHGVITNSVMESVLEVGEGSTVDTCLFHTPLVIEPNTIVSNCVINDPEITVIPSGWLFHSSAIRQNGVDLYVTIAFRLDENLKTCVEHSWRHLAEANCSLWTARLFEARATMSESFSVTWKSVTRQKQETNVDSAPRFSMVDIVRLKHIDGFLQHRSNINAAIHQH